MLRELDVINSEILKRKYAHEDINLLGEESKGNNATLQSERAINYRREIGIWKRSIKKARMFESFIQTVKKFLFIERTNLVKSDITNLLFDRQRRQFYPCDNPYMPSYT